MKPDQERLSEQVREIAERLDRQELAARNASWSEELILARAYLTLARQLTEAERESAEREKDLNLVRGVLSNFQTDAQGYCQACGKADPRDEGHNEGCIIGDVLDDWPSPSATGSEGET